VFDPFEFVLISVVAGINQAANSNPSENSIVGGAFLNVLMSTLRLWILFFLGV